MVDEVNLEALGKRHLVADRKRPFERGDGFRLIVGLARRRQAQLSQREVAVALHGLPIEAQGLGQLPRSRAASPWRSARRASSDGRGRLR